MKVMLASGQDSVDRRLHVQSGANNDDGAFRIESANGNIMDMGTDGTGHFLNCVNTDPFRIKFAGTETFRITNSGQVGINTINPGAKLHIRDTMQATANGHNQILILGDDSGTDGESASIYMSAINATNRGCKILSERQSSSNDHDLIIQTSPAGAIPAERLRITSVGDLLLGTASNGGGNRLYVVDNFTDSFVNPTDSILRVENANDSGTTTQASITLTSQTSGSNADSAIVSQAEDGSGNSSLQFWTDTSNGMSEKMRITSNSEVRLLEEKV